MIIPWYMQETPSKELKTLLRTICTGKPEMPSSQFIIWHEFHLMLSQGLGGFWVITL